MDWSSLRTSLKSLGRRRYRDRLTLGLLAVSLPIAIALVVALTQIASSNLRSSTEGFLEDRAQGISTILDRLLTERQGDMAVVASLLSGQLESPASPRLLAQVVEASDDYDLIEVASLSGTALFGSSEQTFDAGDQEWFHEAAGGKPAISPIYREFDNLRWIVAHPVMGTDGSPEAVVLGDLRVGSLAPFISADFGETAEILLVDHEQRLVLSSGAGRDPAEADLIDDGSLETTLASDAAARSTQGDTGSTDFVDEEGNTVLAGYAPFSTAGWGVIAKQDRGEALQSVTDQRQLGGSLVLLAALLLTTFAFLFARREARHLRALADQSTAASEEVTEKSAELSSASEELAATTTEQSAAVTETSATMEELARAAASIAETVDAVAMQTSETREFLERAGNDIQNSSERTLALAERVNDISAILGLINEIADQTNLLALNAAIEAARAGEGGRGFAVVADEVRRLAERSKNSAADIGKILEDVQSETNATVMAMEKGAKQMTRSLDFWDQITEGAAQVSLTTQQQRSATEQVVGTIEQLTQASQQVSSTAQEIATASAMLATLASNLQQTASAAKDRF